MTLMCLFFEIALTISSGMCRFLSVFDPPFPVIKLGTIQRERVNRLSVFKIILRQTFKIILKQENILVVLRFDRCGVFLNKKIAFLK